MATIVALVGDTHINSLTGLSLNRAPRYKGAEYVSTKSQRAVRRKWDLYWNIVFDLKDRMAAPLVIIFGGDIMDMNIHDPVDHITWHKPMVLNHARDLIQPVIEKADLSFMIEGTDAHGGLHAEMETELADDLGFEPDAERGTPAWGRLWATFGGVTFDIRHHPLTSTRITTRRAAAAVRQQRRLRDIYLDAGHKPPDVHVVFHNHFFADSGKTVKPHTFFCPSWQLGTVYGQRLGNGDDFDPVGGLIFVCNNGHYDADPKMWSVPGRKKPWKEPWT